jgi:hypothetical protein
VIILILGGDEMGQSVKVSKALPVVKAILGVSFPEYKGRKVSVRLSERVFIDTEGGGGSYDRAVAVQMSDGKSADVPNVSPFSGAYMAQVNDGIPLPAGVALVVHSMFCGKDAGIVIHVAPESVRQLAALAGLALPDGQPLAGLLA